MHYGIRSPYSINPFPLANVTGLMISKLISSNGILSVSFEITLRWKLKDLTDDKST